MLLMYAINYTHNLQMLNCSSIQLQGLDFIHNSFLGAHGNLTSATCLVDERWQVKLTDFGLGTLRMADTETPARGTLVNTYLRTGGGEGKSQLPSLQPELTLPLNFLST